MGTDSLGRPEIEIILTEVTNTFRAALIKAYDSGFVAGRKTMADEMKAKLGGIINEAVEPPHSNRTGTIVTESSTKPTPLRKYAWTQDSRAARGSVRQAVLEWIKNSDKGCRPYDISKETGLNKNSIRGALNVLRAQGLAEKKNDYWFNVEIALVVQEPLRRVDLDDDEVEDDEYGNLLKEPRRL